MNPSFPYQAAEAFRCSKCRGRFGPGAFVGYWGTGPKDWGCWACHQKRLSQAVEPAAEIEPVKTNPAIPEEW